MSRVLITHSTNSGSTVEVAEALASQLNLDGHTTEVKQILDAASLTGYDAVIVGAPMIFGWHTPARQFARKYQNELSVKKVAYFSCAMRLTQVPGEKLPDLPLSLDPSLAAAPQRTGTLSIKERFTTTGNYLKPMLSAAPAVKPLSIAFFNGKLEMFRLKWWQAGFVLVVIRATPGDYRDWDFIKDWAKSLSPQL